MIHSGAQLQERAAGLGSQPLLCYTVQWAAGSSPEEREVGSIASHPCGQVNEI